MNTQYIDEKQVSDLTNLSLSTLRNWRFLRKGIPYYKVNHGRKVLYKRADVIDFIEQGRIQIGKEVPG
ncbi:helix-turn-helix domain-containing protein [Candidatus Latescibacterota bacterium]